MPRIFRNVICATMDQRFRKNTEEYDTDDRGP